MLFETSSPPATGDVVGPSSSTDNAIVRFDGTTGKAIQNSGVTIDDSNNLFVPGTANIKIGTTFEFNTLDALSRVQMWNHGASSILRLGASQADGDTSDALTEGASFYGSNIGGLQNSINVGYARIKHNRFGLFSLTDGGALNDYYFRVDPTSLFLRDNSAVKTFEVTRATGDVTLKGQPTLQTAKTPASAADTGTTGTVCWDASYFYVAVGTNQWRRVAHSAW